MNKLINGDEPGLQSGSMSIDEARGTFEFFERLDEARKRNGREPMLKLYKLWTFGIDDKGIQLPDDATDYARDVLNLLDLCAAALGKESLSYEFWGHR